MWTIVLLCLSNVFMTIAWYGPVRVMKAGTTPMWTIVLVSWLIAFIEYCLAVPANRLGLTRYGFETAQLKTMQEIITLIVFVIFSVLVLKEPLRWNYLVGFACIGLAGFFVFYFKPPTPIEPLAPMQAPGYATPASKEP